MSVILNRIERRLDSIRRIDVDLLDVDDRIEYYTEYKDILCEKKAYLISSHMYKTAANLQAEIAGLADKITLLKDFAEEPKLEKGESNVIGKYTYLGTEHVHGDLSITEVKMNVKDFFWGLPVDVRYDGNGFYICLQVPNLNTEQAELRLKEFAKENKFKVENKKEDDREYIYLNISK